MSAVIKSLHALEILDSRGNPTVSVEVELSDGSIGFSSVPSGLSTGEFEAVELRDGDRVRYRGKGVVTAVRNINEIIAPAITDHPVEDQSLLDRMLIELDGTHNKSRLGANAILGVSIAAARAATASMKTPLYHHLSGGGAYSLPLPYVNIISGGVQANNTLDVQEFMIVPHGARSFREAVRMSAEIFHSLGDLLNDDGYHTAVSDEGGYAPRFETMELAFDYIMRAIERADYIPGEDVSIALDVAASELAEVEGDKEVYHFARSNGRRYTSNELISLYEDWLRFYPIVSIEDGLGENDWYGWQALTERLGHQVQLVGDDLFVADLSRLAQAVDTNIANSVLVKLSQVGTLTESIEAIKFAQQCKYHCLVGNRSGDTCDTTAVELAVALGVDGIKIGSICRGERTAKYNALMWIEEKLGNLAKFNNQLGNYWIRQ